MPNDDLLVATDFSPTLQLRMQSWFGGVYQCSHDPAAHIPHIQQNRRNPHPLGIGKTYFQPKPRRPFPHLATMVLGYE